MTISSLVRTAGPYTGNGTATSFPFSFKVFVAADLQVTRTNVDGALSVLVLSSDYTVTLNPDQNATPGGAIVMLSAPAIGVLLFVTSTVSLLQLTALTNQGAFYPKVIEDALDRLTIAQQQVIVSVGAALRVPEVAGVPALPAIALRKNKLLSFDSNGNPAALAPTDGTSAALAVSLLSAAGAANIGFAATGTIAATNVQSAIVEADTEGRAGTATVLGDLIVAKSRITALETAGTSGVIGKATQALLYADLAFAAGTVGYVTNDATTANNGVYLKSGGSGAGSWTQATGWPVGLVADTAAALALATRQGMPLFGEAVTAVKVESNRWLIRTPVSGGGLHDWAEYEMFNMGAYMGITNAWALNSIRAEIGGQVIRFMEQHPIAGNVSTNEFAIYAGKMTDPFNATYYDFFGFGHGHLNYTSAAITLDGGATNYRDLAPIGTVLRGATLLFDSVYAPKIIDGTVIGSTGVAHIFDANGLRVSVQHIITAAGIGAQNSYSAMLATTGCDTIKPVGRTAATVGLHDGGQKGNWTSGPTTWACYNSARPTYLLEMSLPYGHPGTPPGDWSQDTTSVSFVLDNAATKQSKLYVNWRSGTAAVAYFGTYNHLTDYRVRIGTPA